MVFYWLEPYCIVSLALGFYYQATVADILAHRGLVGFRFGQSVMNRLDRYRVATVVGGLIAKSSYHIAILCYFTKRTDRP